MIRYLFYLWPVLLQALLIIHVFKTGRDRYWIYILLFVPFAGGIAYAIVEILPDLLRGRTIDRVQSRVSAALMPNRELERLAATVERSPTVDNLKRLGDEYFNRREFQKAADCYKKCLNGPFGDDPRLMFHYAETLIEIEQYQEAKELLEKVLNSDVKNLVCDTLLLLGQSSLRLQQTSEAEEHYALAAKKGAGLKYRCLYAVYLKNAGKTVQAAEEYQQVVEEYKLMPRHSKKLNSSWYSRAKRDLLHMSS